MHNNNILDINGGVPIINVPGVIDKKFYEEIERDSSRILKIVYKIVNYGFKLNGMGFI